MPVSTAFRAFVADQFALFDGVSIRPMFGGLGVFHDGRMFAMAVSDVLYFRAGEGSGRRFAAEGSSQFTYAARNGREMAMPYWQVPARLFDDTDAFRDWAMTAMRDAAAEKVAPKKPKSPRRPG